MPFIQINKLLTIGTNPTKDTQKKKETDFTQSCTDHIIQLV